MPKAIIYYFSGTGNTRIIAEMILNELNRLNVTTDLYDIRSPFSGIPDPSDFDYVGFGYPVHAFNTPEFVLKFIDRLPDAPKTPTFIFKTSGEPFRFNNASSWPLIRKLRKKGFVPLTDEHLLMPYNIMFRYPEAIAKHMYAHNIKLATVIARKVISGKNCLPRYHFPTIILMYLARLQWLGAKINGPLIHVQKQLCTACGLCIRNCPGENIGIKKGYPKFDHRCTMCMSCATVCPVDAVRPGFLNNWRINGGYDFQGFNADDSLPSVAINEETKGYFRLFRSYYDKSNAMMKRWLEENQAP